MKKINRKKSNIAKGIRKIHKKDDWRDALDSILINDDHWRCIVTMMVETIPEHNRCISLFNAAAEEGEQTCIYSLSYQKAIDTVKRLSKQDPEKCLAIEGICHYANTVLNENNGCFSTWLTARIIKYLIYRAKIEHIGRLKIQADREIDEEYRTIRNIGDGSTSSRSSTEPRRVYSGEAERTFNGKANSRLHVDDVPFDAQNLHVVLSGFRNPDLPAELLSVEVPLTCILEIKLPGEQYVAYHERKDSGLREGTRFFEDRTDENELLEFWTITHERFANLSAYPVYSNIAILNLCPPILPEAFNATEKELLKRNMYDKVLFTLRHLSDLCRQHAKYLKSMKLERGIINETGETVDTKIYEKALNDIPNEYINVPLILGAILLQVESNLVRSSDGCFPVDRNAGFSDADARHGNTSTTAERIPVSTMQDKLKLLDLKYELTDEYTDNVSQSFQPSELKVVPYGDTLSMIRHSLDRPNDLDDAVLCVLRDPRIIGIWQNHEVLAKSRIEMYSCHFDNIARAFDKKQTVSREEIMHYLHLLMFDKLIFPKDNQEVKARFMQPLKDELSTQKYSRSTIMRTHSVPNLTLSLIPKSNLRRSKSDTGIDYGKPVAAFTDCPLLFALTDTRETLLPGYLYTNVLKKRSCERPSLDEYEDVELLSDRVFPQVVHECFQSFDRFAAGYCEPTDSLLLYFSNNNVVGDVSEETRLSSIRTPIGLREFCKYIAVEEENWMERERETRQSRKTDLTGRFMERSAGLEEDAIIFDDECFVLPDSLKARHLKISPDRKARRKIFETRGLEVLAGTDVEGKKMTRQTRNEAPTANNGGKWTDGRVMDGKTSMTAKKLGSETDDVDMSVLSAKKNPSSERDVGDEPYDLVGYDLGSLRVQVIHHSKKFLLGDDTSVRVELDDWLYGDLDLRIAVTLQHCTLRLSRGVGRRQLADTFHLTTSRGVVLAFCRNRTRELAAIQNSSDCRRRNLAFDFRASWPSGLLIEPTIEDGTKNPFCIRQSYVSERPGCAGAAREVYRNFLRDGSVLKYLDDNTVVILRPNGVIVTCTDFNKPRSHDESIHPTTLRAGFKIEKDDPRQSVMAKRGGRVTGSTESRSNGSIVDIQPSKQHVTPAGDCVTSNRDSLITGAFAAGEVLRYLVVNYDGRRYEVLNDLVVSEHDRLLVTTTSDYEVNEVFTRRADGTDTLLRSNGELVVTFPDGTNIVTGYTIEEQPITCEWSWDELKRYFGSSETKGSGDWTTIAPSFDSEFSPENSAIPYVDYQEKLTRLSIADGFVSILLTLCMEHKDYATVSYDQLAVECTLSMANNLRVSISRRGHYEVSIGDKVNLKIRDDDAVFSNICTTCGGRSVSTYKFWESSEAGPRTILTTIDILGNVLEVKSDGTTRYREDRRYIRRGHECTVLEYSEERSSEKEEEEEEDANSEARIHCKHERYCEMLKFPGRSQYRIFAMNRDLTAYEYLHRSVRNEQEVAAVFGDETSMIQYPISRRPELRRLITFVPAELESRSKETSCQYKVTSDKRTDRRELSRSTYSSPYNWLLPFGKKDQGVFKRTQSEVLAQRNEQPLPKLLRVRVFFSIKEAGRSVLIDMQRAMGCYWISVFRDGDKCRLFYATGSSRPCKVENDYSSSEDGLRELVLGVKGSIDVETYVKSLRGKLIKVSTKAPRQSSRLAELLRQRGSMRKEYEWYKQCMRKRIIVPYFQNIADSRYFLVKHDDEGISKGSHLRVAKKRDEFIDSDSNEKCCQAFY